MIFNIRSIFYYEYNPYKIGTTDKCEYIPIYAALSLPKYTQGYISEEVPMKEITGTPHYQVQALKVEVIPSSRYKTYPDLFTLLESARNTESFEIKYQDEYYHIGVTTGFMVDKYGNILLALCTKNPTELFTEEGKVNFSNLRLMISSEMKSNPVYKNLFKKIDSDYITQFYENHSEVLFTTSEKIEKKLYGNNFKISFNSLTELETILKPENVMESLFYEEEPISVDDDIFGELDEAVPSPGDLIDGYNVVTVPFSSFNQTITSEGATIVTNAADATYTVGIDPVSPNSEVVIFETNREQVISRTREALRIPVNEPDGDEIPVYQGMVHEGIPYEPEPEPTTVQFVLVDDDEAESSELEYESQNGTEEEGESPF